MRTCILTTCVGRWRFLEQAYSTWCNHLAGHTVHEVYCVTSDQCTDVTGEKARALGMRVVLTELERDLRGRPLFHKTRLLNLGMQQAKKDRYERVVLLDADTTVMEGFAGEIAEVPEYGYFGFCRSPITARDLAGVLVVNIDDWQAIGGMDERIRDWGAEDLDMRLRLRFSRGIDYVRLDPNTLLAFSHSDELRTELYRAPDKFASLAVNNTLMAENYQAVVGSHLAVDLASSLELQELLGLTDELRQRGARLATLEDGRWK